MSFLRPFKIPRRIKFRPRLSPITEEMLILSGGGRPGNKRRRSSLHAQLTSLFLKPYTFDDYPLRSKRTRNN